MKFIHTSDLHLGVRPDAGPEYTKRRPEEIWETFKSILDRCEDEQIDLLLISGDVFHRQPLLRELKELNAMFAGLSHTKVVFTAGNHDYLKPNSMYRNFKWAGNVVPLLEGTPSESRVPGISDRSIRIQLPGQRIAGRNQGRVEVCPEHGKRDSSPSRRRRETSFV